jgi:hypothetical protein
MDRALLWLGREAIQVGVIGVEDREVKSQELTIMSNNEEGEFLIAS